MKSDMELQYLKYFSSVAETLNFSEAAKRCHVSQPSLSSQIKILEERLGTQLFHRSKRTVSLTKEGQALIPKVRKILMELDGLTNSARDMQDALAGNIFVGATPLIELSSLIDRLTVVLKENPRLKLSFIEEGSDPLIDALEKTDLDLIFLPYNPRLESSRFQYRESERLDVVVCTPKNGPKDLPFLQVKPGCGMREFMADAATALGKDPTSYLQATHFSMIKKWIQLQLGWSVLPARCITKADLKHIQVTESSVLEPVRICAAMLKGQRADQILAKFGA